MMCCRSLTLRVKEVDPSPEPVEETHVDEDPGCVVLHVSCVLGAVIRVIPETVVTTLLKVLQKQSYYHNTFHFQIESTMQNNKHEFEILFKQNERSTRSKFWN